MRFAPQTIFAASLALMVPGLASAQANGECTGDSDDPACGAPDQSGGGGCGCGGGSILINFTDQGDSYQYADDYDDDAWEDNFDNCPFAANADQADADGDGYGDACDNCINDSNPDQFDVNGNSMGDACDPDADGDLIPNLEDNCMGVPNPNQTNTNGNAFGDACDTDDDGDGCEDTVDRCPLKASTNCLDDQSFDANECFADMDADNIPDHLDNCPGVGNPGQENTSGEGAGDACDPDKDGDGLANNIDNCADIPNPDQLDSDRDRLGDTCDPRFCYVVTTEDNCLDPAAPFAVHAAKPFVMQTGQESDPLSLWSNRDMKAWQYTWTIESQPEGGNATITNPKGAVSVSDGFAYFYEESHEARFVPSVPGEYILKLQGELAFDDGQYPGQTAGEDRVIIQVEGDTVGPCSHSNVPRSNALWAVAAFGLLGLALRRRRR